jgi:hypothetical protein
MANLSANGPPIPMGSLPGRAFLVLQRDLAAQPNMSTNASLVIAATMMVATQNQKATYGAPTLILLISLGRFDRCALLEFCHPSCGCER